MVLSKYDHLNLNLAAEVLKACSKDLVNP